MTVTIPVYTRMRGRRAEAFKKEENSASVRVLRPTCRQLVAGDLIFLANVLGPCYERGWQRKVSRPWAAAVQPQTLRLLRGRHRRDKGRRWRLLLGRPG